MVPIAHQVAGIFGTKYEKRVEIGVPERLLGASQPVAVHPLRVEPILPIDGNDTDIGHDGSS